ncbi:DUF4174 domain-containing protein [Pseudodonghicola xiamenensis]|uniref:DUF4174 domain-containing protein n=1 Tax=Pseudodonghicola xiamenensis TaxID=337702 RepID=A0A8J3MES5_9RHOB|nr:DUF4174 domain-containing protein [Pseudodonghicola xiamenensis]GHG99892.1 hypothetical protein GCM10010961_36070 [Pseudodonghicola xiamenensis]
MTRILAFVLSALIPLSAMAQDTGATDAAPPLIQPATDMTLSGFLWLNRPVVVFADTPNDPRYIDQIAMLRAEAARLTERDVLVLTDTDPGARSPVRQKLRPRGFQIVLIDKDGTVALRRPSPQSVREITRSIDKTPLRQREVEERRAAPSE